MPTSRGHRPARIPLPLSLAVAAAALVGCSSGSEPSATTRAEAQPTTVTTAATTTTTEPRPDADAATVALAEAATLRDADYPEPWTIFEAAGVVTPDVDICAEGSDTEVASLPIGAVQRGDYMQFGEEQGWVTTTSYVLEDAAGAEAWVAWIDDDVWADCWLEKWQKQQDDAGSGAEVRIKTRENASLGTQGFESLLEAEVLDAEGELVTIYSVQVFRIDRVVIHVSLTIGGMEDETYTTFYAQYSEATSAAYDRVNALL